MRGRGRSVYARWICRALSLTAAFGIALNSVVATAGGALPQTHPYRLADDAPPAPAAAPAAEAPAPAAADKGAQENIFWESAQRSNTIADYQAYLTAFPNGLFAPLARNRIAAISAAPPPAPALQTQPTPPPPPMTPSAFGPPPPPVSAEEVKGEIGTVETEQLLNMGPPARMELQMRLSAIGLYNGPVDGALGPGARAAIAEWQKRHGAAPTGELGPLQLAALRNESEPAYEQVMASRPAAPPPMIVPEHRVYHAAHPAPSYVTPAAIGILSGLAIGILGAKLGGKGGGGGGGGKGHKQH